VDDLAAELNRFDVSVAPLRIARGIQNKVLEAMAAAKPVVLTSRAAAGIGAEDGRDYLVHDTPEAMAGAVRALLGDPSARQRIGAAARRYVAEHHRWMSKWMLRAARDWRGGSHRGDDGRAPARWQTCACHCRTELRQMKFADCGRDLQGAKSSVFLNPSGQCISNGFARRSDSRQGR